MTATLTPPSTRPDRPSSPIAPSFIAHQSPYHPVVYRPSSHLEPRNLIKVGNLTKGSIASHPTPPFELTINPIHPIIHSPLLYFSSFLLLLHSSSSILSHPSHSQYYYDYSRIQLQNSVLRTKVTSSALISFSTSLTPYCLLTRYSL